MSQPIINKLLRGEAFRTLEMETLVAERFRACGWPATVGTYYTDPITDKLREIDIRSSPTYPLGSKSWRTGSPLINLSVFSECKTLEGFNVILASGKRDQYDVDKIVTFWVGEDNGGLGELARIVCRTADANSRLNASRTYKYLVSRAYPNDGRALRASFKLPLPPVDFIAHGFRETRGGDVRSDDTSSHIWSAIQSTLSVVKANQIRAKRTAIEWISDDNRSFEGKEYVASIAANMFDAELARLVASHPVIFAKCKLWKRVAGSLQEVGSARLSFTSIDGPGFYVDLVNWERMGEYIEATTKHFDAHAHRSLRALRRRLQELHWNVGELESSLLEALGTQ